MKLVIELDEKFYEWLMTKDDTQEVVYKAVRKGIPLPKGHGDLKYIDAFKYWCETNEENGVITIPKFICDNIIKILDNAPVVIKADKKNNHE